ncbi:MAG: twin-arginine translocase TatA/TatE family subunit [Acidobacteriaceae bacterium]|nr:twin-arginine translocase TatA/TatE family subunit [Acidobacteriaceae bacterium]MBV9766289.1 twin-arginine translocase TatA/TatE family subunit [Acidobacteriaceae bacterium]
MGPLGMQEMIAIFVLALLLFGPKKLPELGRMLGKGLSEFRRAKNELKTTFETHLHELEQETRSQVQPASNTDYSSTHAPYSYDEYGRYGSEYPYSAGSHDSSPSLETGNSEPTASATATQDAEAHRDYSSSQTLPVADTVPRSNGIPSAERNSTVPEEHHPV